MRGCQRHSRLDVKNKEHVWNHMNSCLTPKLSLYSLVLCCGHSYDSSPSPAGLWSHSVCLPIIKEALQLRQLSKMRETQSAQHLLNLRTNVSAGAFYYT